CADPALAGETPTYPPSLPGLTPQVGFTRLAAPNNAQLVRARVAVQSMPSSKKLFAKKMDARASARSGASSTRFCPRMTSSANSVHSREICPRESGERESERLAPKLRPWVPALAGTNEHNVTCANSRSNA